jgi:hypothetical protein
MLSAIQDYHCWKKMSSANTSMTLLEEHVFCKTRFSRVEEHFPYAKEDWHFWKNMSSATTKWLTEDSAENSYFS